MLQKKTVVITGASSGLGASLAVAFAEMGANLVLFSRNQERLEEVESLCQGPGDPPIIVTGDIAQPDDCERLMASAISQFGTLDYLVTNAGVSMWAKFENICDVSIFSKIMETNYLGTVHCVYYALPYLRKSQGMIVAISSIQGKIGVPFHTGYTASKHAIQGFFASLRAELTENDIDILIVTPHWLRGTSLRENAFGKDGNVIGISSKKHSQESISLQKCSQAILNAASKRKKELMIPPKLKILPWLNLINPKIVDFFVKQKMLEQDSE